MPGHRFILNLIPTQHNFNRHLPLVNLWWRISFGSRPQQHFFGPGEYVKICVRELKTYEFCSPAKALTERANTTRQRRGIQGGQVNIKEVCSGFHMDVQDKYLSIWKDHKVDCLRNTGKSAQTTILWTQCCLVQWNIIYVARWRSVHRSKIHTQPEIVFWCIKGLESLLMVES